MPGPINEIIELLREDLAHQTARLVAGEISLARWQRECGLLIGQHTNASWMAGSGRVATAIEQREIYRETNRQLGYLRRFAEEIRAGNLSEAQIAARINMYADRMRGFYGQGQEALEGVHLPQVPGDGQTQCLTNCRCHLEFKPGEQDFTTEVYWRMDEAAEHCPDCVRLAGQWNPLVVGQR